MMRALYTAATGMLAEQTNALADGLVIEMHGNPSYKFLHLHYQVQFILTPVFYINFLCQRVE